MDQSKKCERAEPDAESLLSLHTAQVLSYLKATNLELAILINFNVRYLRDGVKRVIRSS